jgi:hypothetical protein
MPTILTIFNDFVDVLRYSTIVPVCFLDHVDGFLNMTTPVHEPINDFVNVLQYSTVVPVCFLDHVDGFLNMTTPVHVPINDFVDVLQNCFCARMLP